MRLNGLKRSGEMSSWWVSMRRSTVLIRTIKRDAIVETGERA
jgi:hypothetical protein